MSSRGSDWTESLRRAAGSDDALDFDAAMDRLLERARDQADPDAGLQALVSARVHARVGAEPASAKSLARAPNAASLSATSSRWARYGKRLGLLGGGVAIGFIWGRSALWWPPPAPAPGIPVASSTAEPNASRALAPSDARGGSDSYGEDAVAAPVAADEGRKAEAREPAARLPVRTSATRSPSMPARATRASDAGSLRFALEQLRKAQLFLREGEPHRALEALEVLDARVAASVLQEEREVTRTLALCDAGDVAAAGVLARRFLERAPDSAYAVSLRESCAGKAALLDQMRERTSNPSR
jgi:hypothetical protein